MPTKLPKAFLIGLFMTNHTAFVLELVDFPVELGDY